MKPLLIVIIITYSVLTNSFTNQAIVIQNEKVNEIVCSDIGCEGTYKGAEFINGSDIAHQFSNTMSAKVGLQLKELYNSDTYVKVDFSKIIMSTKGMGSGNVAYYLYIPFKKVKEPCLAITSFDHVGGWNHKPSLLSRKAELRKVLMKGHEFNVSELKTTSEGLQEYWIQWKNKVVQASCN